MTNDVNLWAKKETNGLIKEILPSDSVNNLTKLIFANALYFKGVWDQQFDTSDTKDYDFHIRNGNLVKVPFMTSKEDQFISVFDDFKVLRLPYGQGEDKRQFSMYFFLPNARDGLSALIEKVASQSELIHQNLQRLSQKRVGDFRIPRFNVSFGFETSDMLKELGVVLPFSPGGLTNMVDFLTDQDLFVSHIFHKSFIEVNEEGTEAAAVTAAVFGIKGVIPQVDFVADHPFLFLIREDLTETILFVGQVLNSLVE